ncbi:Ethanolamine utilization protein like [Actinidia chinensis var. chinensis]|uniref:Ethanolamine utilization protein like n=1 Tax=Actinidia chinensis var. chinensis TaxID=1590841 RepID=A0A2R6QTN8_ACTCC|nr:Ethanolamine utilization protein like [Actinidia chinensis var. chinensis]
MVNLGLNNGFVSLALLVPVIVLLSLSLFSYNNHSVTTPHTTESTTDMTATATTSTIVIPTTATITTFGGVKIERNPSESKLTQLGVSSWPKWGGSPSKFPWTFTAKETMYLLEGKVKVYCDGYDGFFEIGAGDLVEFPKGMKVTWDVIEAVNKHYNVEK